jgi:hypothetical protein
MPGRVAIRVLVLGLVLVHSGCSALLVLSGKATPNLGVIRVGSTRAEVEAQLGRPISSATDDSGRNSVLYEYQRGNDPEPERAIIHGLLDAFSLGLWELAGVTIEAAQGSAHRIIVMYGRDGRVVAIKQLAAGQEARGSDGAQSTGTSGKEEAVATALERYAALLQESDQNALAAIVGARAKSLRAVACDGAGTYLGFNPSQLLRQYAALLSERGRGDEAKEIQDLAEWREEAQIEQFGRPHGGRP